jgi:hypothetical protein
MKLYRVNTTGSTNNYRIVIAHDVCDAMCKFVNKFKFALQDEEPLRQGDVFVYKIVGINDSFPRYLYIQEDIINEIII